MAEVVHIDYDHGITSHHNEKEEFKRDIQIGLSKKNKQIPSRYFYDEHGSELFNKITRHSSYYLTRCELEILAENKQRLSAMIGHKAFNLVELGPGEGIKTQILIQQFLRDARDFHYIPIDISTKYLKTMVNQFRQNLPELEFTPLHSDYIHGLEWLSKQSSRRNLVLFLGSSIGNYNQQDTEEFVKHMWKSLNNNDYVLIGFDLRKDIHVLMQAYDDNNHLTREFNFNLLRRINRELKADFDLKNFQHYPTYNVNTGAMESYLVSLKQQAVTISALNEVYQFDKIEPLLVEYSYKYLLSQIENIATQGGFEIVENFMDADQFFVDTLWQVKK